MKVSLNGCVLSSVEGVGWSSETSLIGGEYYYVDLCIHRGHPNAITEISFLQNLVDDSEVCMRVNNEVYTNGRLFKCYGIHSFKFVFTKCLLVKETTPRVSEEQLINKIKAEAVREAKYSCSYDDIGNDCFDGEIKVCLAMDLEDHANKLERGEV